MPRSSNGMFVNSKGHKVTSLTDLTPVAKPSEKTGTPIPAGTRFPGSTKLIPAGSVWTWYWQIKISGMLMGADGKHIPYYTPAFGGSGSIMAALSHLPDPSLVDGPNTRIMAEHNGQLFSDIPKMNAVERDNAIIEYRDLIDLLAFDPENPDYLAQAQIWVALAGKVNYFYETQYAPGKWGPTRYENPVTMANVEADILRVQTDLRVTFGAEDV